MRGFLLFLGFVACAAALIYGVLYLLDRSGVFDLYDDEDENETSSGFQWYDR